MKQVKLGQTDISISAIVMGTWQAGKKMWTGIDDAETTAAMRAAFEAGITTFDTAPAYGDGHSERIVGKALKDVRDRVILATKVFPHHLAADKLAAACHQSLRDLDTDVIDLYQIHWPAGSFGSPKVPIEESMEALNRLKADGKIRAIGVSNFSRAQMEEAAQYGEIESLQPPYSLFWRAAETDGIAFCRETGRTVLAYSPMAQGILTGKFGPNPTFEKGDHRSANRLFSPEMYPKVLTALDRLRPIAERHELTLGQLALAWVAGQPNSVAIAGARNPEQAAQNAAAGSAELPPETLAEMDAIGRDVTGALDDNPVMWQWGKKKKKG
jgi:aryl-alcohol dehydrogenase-like predicted oxidoreductase